jgi:hypothetical protein
MDNGFERIVLEVDDGDTGSRPRKGFYGRWLVSPSEPFEYHDKLYVVAITQKRKLVVYVTHEDDRPPFMDVYDNLASIPRANCR